MTSHQIVLYKQGSSLALLALALARIIYDVIVTGILHRGKCMKQGFDCGLGCWRTKGGAEFV